MPGGRQIAIFQHAAPWAKWPNLSELNPTLETCNQKKRLIYLHCAMQ